MLAEQSRIRKRSPSNARQSTPGASSFGVTPGYLVGKMVAGGDGSMIEQVTSTPASLFEQDETAWLEQTASLVAQGRFGEVDHDHLSEYLTDMARRDKREVFSRLVTLLAHLLKWEHQPENRSNSWRGTILEQRRELRLLLESGSLRRHAAEL